MEAFDTNVIIRLLTKDDEEQSRRAEQAFRRAIAQGGAWLSLVVLVEISWVLQVAYKFDRATIASALDRLSRTHGVVLENAPVAEVALVDYEDGPADFADYLILESARAAGAKPLNTFDTRLSRSADVTLL